MQVRTSPSFFAACVRAFLPMAKLAHAMRAGVGYFARLCAGLRKSGRSVEVQVDGMGIGGRGGEGGGNGVWAGLLGEELHKMVKYVHTYFVPILEYRQW